MEALSSRGFGRFGFMPTILHYKLLCVKTFVMEMCREVRASPRAALADGLPDLSTGRDVVDHVRTSDPVETFRASRASVNIATIVNLPRWRPEVSRDALGDLEHQVLLAALRLAGEAYSVSVVLEIEERTHRSPAQSAVFIALRRLEEKGFLRSSLEKKEEESGRTRRYFQITPAGRERLREMRKSLLGLWDGIAAELDGAL